MWHSCSSQNRYAVAAAINDWRVEVQAALQIFSQIQNIKDLVPII